jgi:nicotinate-nucleotide adenylyltransferase
MNPVLQFLQGCRKRWHVPSSAPKRIGVYGGKFDPPHTGHLIFAEMVRDAFKLDKVLFVTSFNPPHKATGFLDPWIRHEMVEAAVGPNCFFEACDIESERDGPSYMRDTILALKAKYGPDTELFLMVSSEYLEPSHKYWLPKWVGSEVLFANCRVLVSARGDHTAEQIQEWVQEIAKVSTMDIQVLAYCPSLVISSTMIRERIAGGDSVWYFVTPEVWKIIRRRKLYGFTPPRSCNSWQKYWDRFRAVGRAFALFGGR